MNLGRWGCRKERKDHEHEGLGEQMERNNNHS